MKPEIFYGADCEIYNNRRIKQMQKAERGVMIKNFGLIRKAGEKE